MRITSTSASGRCSVRMPGSAAPRGRSSRTTSGTASSRDWATSRTPSSERRRPNTPSRSTRASPAGRPTATEVGRLTATPSQQLHRFCQFDFPFPPGPPDGRYLLRNPSGDADVIVLATVGAELRREGRSARAMRRRRAARAEPEDEGPEVVTVTRVTVIRGTPVSDEAARAWIAGCSDPAVASEEVAEALQLLTRAVHAHRVAAGAPYAADVSREGARRIRLGFGNGDEVVDGRWSDAYALPPQPPTGRRRRRMLEPHEELAGILGGRRSVHPSEDLLLRARLDLDQQRMRAAALQAQAGHAAFVAELADDQAAGEERAALEGRRELLGRL